MIDMTAVDREIRSARAELADPGNVKGILSLPTRVRIWRAMLDPDDDDLLPDSLESSYSCASAAAGALNWMPLELTDVPARRAFWTWYLNEAIPTTLAT